MTKVEAAIAFCGLYEAELLASLMLRYWDHPRCTDQEFAKELVEDAAEVLVRSRDGDRFFQDLRPGDMNFVAALWYAESSQVTDAAETDTQARQEWLARVRHSLPSCFCDPTDLA